MRVYIAGPYTKGDVALNVRSAIEAGDAVLKAGHLPFIPHLCHYWHTIFPGRYEQWTAYDLGWLPVCEAFIRLSGESGGADAEEQAAKRLGLPIYYSVAEFLAT